LAAMLEGLPAQVSLEVGISQVGGGSLPGEELPTTLVCIRTRDLPVAELARRLRVGEPSVWGRVQRNALLLDPRTVLEEELAELAQSLRQAVCAGATTAEERE
ncbi:MAG: L-seryl-tRNA(Sec) selenium transferase, partial [Actinomycetota bacterium]